MGEFAFDIGDRVNYHSVIGGPPTAQYTIRDRGYIPSADRPVYWLAGKAGCVAEAALSKEPTNAD